MKPERWRQIDAVLGEALELESSRRDDFLNEACAGDEELRGRIDALLAAHEQAESFIEVPALAAAAQALAGEARSMLGRQLGHYHVSALVGAGGMGTVWKARDTRLDRDVALKTLPEGFTHDTDWLARFEREAKLLASLNHPNIAAIHGLDEDDGRRFLVLEFIQGETLADRISRGAIPLDESLKLALQISDALEAAHEKGIVHRDLKPSNIALAAAGKVKVLDFGLAKIFGQAEPGGAAKNPAPNSSESDRSLAMGTPSYMSPEQIQGNVVDTRADIWAFGCVLYELLTGRKAFTTDDAPTVESILNREPDWNLLPTRTPAALVRLLRQCLEKNRTRRLQSAKDLRNAIEGIQTRRQRTRWIRTAVMMAGIALAGSLLFVQYVRKPDDLRVTKMDQMTFDPDLELDPALSPDGEWLAYAGGAIEHLDIYIRRLSGGGVKNLTQGSGSDYNRWPRWSGDGKHLAFVSENPLQPQYGQTSNVGYVIQIASPTGGKPHAIAESAAYGHTWSPDGKKLAYIRDNTIYVVTIDGEVSRKLAPTYNPHSPSWSPNGKWIAFVSGNSELLFVPSVMGNVAASAIVIVDPNTGELHWLTDTSTGNFSPVWMPDSRSILFLSNRGGSHDVFELKISDGGQPMGDPVRVTAGLGALSIDVSVDGRKLAYARFILKSNLASLPIPQSGKVSSAAAVRITTGAEIVEGVNVSGDGKWIAYDSNLSGNQDIFRMPRMGGSAEQLTYSAQGDFQPDWSSDGRFIAFHSFRNGNRDLYVMSADGDNQQQVTNDPAQERYPDWSRDGQSLVFYLEKAGHREVFRVNRENGRWGRPVQLTFTQDGAAHPRWSPDGHTIAYIDYLNGLSVMASDGKNAQVLVAQRPGFAPGYVAWSRDSATIYFRARDDRHRYNIWSVPLVGGEPKLLVQFKDLSRLEFTTDDKDFFFTVSERESDIWILELKR